MSDDPDVDGVDVDRQVVYLQRYVVLGQEGGDVVE